MLLWNEKLNVLLTLVFSLNIKCSTNQIIRSCFIDKCIRFIDKCILLEDGGK